MILNEEEIKQAIREYGSSKGNGYGDLDTYMEEFIAKAQLKKVYDWGCELCTEHIKLQIPARILKRECQYCWQALLEVKE